MPRPKLLALADGGAMWLVSYKKVMELLDDGKL